MTLSLVDTSDIQQKLSFFSTPQPTLPSAQNAQVTASKMDYTLGGNSPGHDQLYQQLVSGNEDQIRQKMALDKNVQDQTNKLKIVDAVTKAGNGQPMNQQQYDFINNLTNTQINNPATIFESEYAKKVFSDLLFTNPDQNAPINQAYATDAPKTDALLDVGQENFTKQEIVRKSFEDIQTKQSALGIPGKVQQFLEPWIPFHRNLTLQTRPLFPTALGEDVHAQYQAFRFMNADEFEKAWTKRISELAAVNLDYAQEFMEGYMNETSDARFWGNVGTILDYSTITPLAKGLSGGKTFAEILAESGLKEPPKLGIPTELAGKDAADYAAAVKRIEDTHKNDLSALNEANKGNPAGLNDPVYQKQLSAINDRLTTEMNQVQTIRDEHLQALTAQIKAVTEAAQSNSIGKTLAAAGKTEQAARVEASRAVEAESLGPTSSEFNKEAEDLVRHIPSYADPNSVLKGPFNTVQFASTALAETIRSIQTSVVDALTKKIGIERLTTEQSVQIAMKEAEDRLKKELNVNDAMGNVSYKPVLAEDTLTNTYHIQADFTRPGGQLFKTNLEAYGYASKALGLPKGGKAGGSVAIRQGDGWFLRVTRPVDETTGSVRDTLIDTENETPAGKYGVNTSYVAQKLRSANQLMGKSQIENRNAVVHGVQGISQALSTIIEPIAALSKDSRGMLNRFLTHLADTIKTTSNPNYASNIGEFTEKWVEVNGAQPTVKETQAYFATREMYNFDWMLRNISAYTGLSRQGITNITVKGQEFLGKFIEDTSVLDQGSYGLLVDGETPFFSIRGVSGDMSKDALDAHKSLITDQGYRLIQVGDPDGRPLKDIEGRIINFVISKSAKNRSIALDQIPYDPSQITKYDYKHAVAQPRISPIQGRNIYMGDSLIMQAQSAKQAKEWASALEYVRQEYKGIKENLALKAKPILEDTELAKSNVAAIRFQDGTVLRGHSHFEIMDSPEYAKMPQGSVPESGFLSADGKFLTREETGKIIGRKDGLTTSEGVQQAQAKASSRRAGSSIRFSDSPAKRLETLRNFIHSKLPFASEDVLDAFDEGKIHLDHPITSTPANEATIDNPAFKATTNIRNDGRVNPYNLIRGLDKVRDETPILKLDQQKVLDPLIGISRGLNRMTRNAFLNDYQTQAAEQFVREFRDVLDVPRQSLEANPIAYLMEPKWASNVDATTLAKAQNFQLATKNLLGAQSFTAKSLSAWRGKEYERMFDKYGAKTDDMLNNWALSKIRDPFTLARAAVQQLKIGLFNVTQYWKQLQTLTISAAIVGPTVSYKAAGAFMLQQAYKLGKPEFLDHFDNLATSLGWQRGWLTELHDLAFRSKLLQVEGEHIYNENLIDPNIVQWSGGRILDWGQAPWRAGERATRQFSLNAAYLEWRTANPTATLNRRAEMSILARQDLLNVNMTKASQSAIQAGTGSFGGDFARTMLQFASYQMRVWELMTGHTLSRDEKIRMFLMQSALYGVPVAVGTTLPWPWMDTYRKKMLAEGQVGNGGTLEELVTKGIPEVMMHAILGKEYDVNSVYGAPSISLFHDAAQGDNSLLDTLLGATGTTFSQIIQTAYPAIVSLQKINDPSSWGLIGNDFIDVLKNVSSVNYGMKLYYAMHAGQALTRSGRLVADDITTVDGVLMAAFGISPQEIADVGNLTQIAQSTQAAKDYAGQQIGKYIRQWVQIPDTDPKGRDAAFTMAQKWAAMGGLDGTEFSRVVRQTVSDTGSSLFDKLNFELMMKTLPKETLDSRQNQYFSGVDKAHK